jgi:hypothetical protein
MTHTEIKAYNQGIRTVLDTARRAAEALQPEFKRRPTRAAFAIDALLELADAGELFLLPLPGATDAPTSDVAPIPRSPKPAAPTNASVQPADQPGIAADG